jgi:hypothetical protein
VETEGETEVRGAEEQRLSERAAVHTVNVFLVLKQ